MCYFEEGRETRRPKCCPEERGGTTRKRECCSEGEEQNTHSALVRLHPLHRSFIIM
jgi:hypothetical protein